MGISIGGLRCADHGLWITVEVLNRDVLSCLAEGFYDPLALRKELNEWALLVYSYFFCHFLLTNMCAQ